MLPSRPSVLCLKAYESDIEPPCMSNRKSPRGTLEAHPSCILLTSGTQENVHAVPCTHHECRQSRVRCRTPPYFSENLCSTHCSDFRVPENQQQPLVRVRAASEDRRGSHICHEGPCTDAQQRLPYIFVRANHESGISSHPSTTDFQATTLCQAPVASVRNRMDYASTPCLGCEGQQNSLPCPHAPCVRIRSPTGDHRIATRVAERIQTFYPSPPPPPPPPPRPSSSILHLVDQRDPLPLEGHLPCGMGRHLCWTRPIAEPVSNIQPSSEPMHVHLSHQPSMTSFIPAPALPSNELHQPECPLKAAHPSVSYFWVKSSSNEQQEHLPGLESHRRFEQEKSSYVWMRHAPRARSEIHAGMVRPPLVTPCQQHVRNNSECQKNCSFPEDRPPALEHLPAFILIRNKPEVNPCAESITVPGRNTPPFACNNLTRNNKPSSSSESLQSEYQTRSRSASPNGPVQFLSSADGEMEQPAYGSRSSIPDDGMKTSPIMQDCHSAHPSIYLLVRNTDKVPTTHLPQDGVKVATECSRTANVNVNLNHLPFAGPFPERETFCKLEKLGTVVQEPGTIRDSLEEERAQVNPSADDLTLLFSAPQKIKIGKNPLSTSLPNMYEYKDASFSTDKNHQQSNLAPNNMDEYLDRTIPRSGAPPTLVQSHFTSVTSEHQKDLYCMLHYSRSVCEQQPTASDLASSCKPQSEYIHCAAGDKTEEEAPLPPAPTSSPASRVSPTLHITQCSLLEAFGNKNNSSPRTPSPDLEEDREPYLLVQNILQNCESKTVSPCLQEAALGQQPCVTLETTPDVKKTEISDSLHSSGEQQTPQTVNQTGLVNHNFLYARCSSSQACLMDQQSTKSEQIMPEVPCDTNRNPDSHCLEKPQTNDTEYNRQAGDPGRSCCEHLQSQSCQSQQAPVQSIPNEPRETNSRVGRLKVSTNNQPSLSASQLSREGQTKPRCSSGTKPCVVPKRPISTGDRELSAGHVPSPAESHSSPFMYFEVLRSDQPNSTHHSSNQLVDQGVVRSCPVPAPATSTGTRDVTSQHLQSRKIVQLTYRKASIRRVVQCQTPQQPLGTITEDENELGKSRDGSCKDTQRTGAKTQLHLNKQDATPARHS